MKIRITEGQYYKLLKEGIDLSMVNGLKGLIESGQEYSIELAKTILEGSEVSEEEFLREHYSEFLVLLEIQELKPTVERIARLLNKESFNLNSLGLTSLPECIGKLQKLRGLYLIGNMLTSLPESIGNLKNLEYLEISDNMLSSLPESIGGLQKLVKLNLYKNKLESLPKSIGALANLETLHVSSNQLKSLPETIGNLQNLKVLSIDSNKIPNGKKYQEMLPYCHIKY